MNRVFIDMDGVLADFDRLKGRLGMTGEELKRIPNAFDIMEPIAGAIDGVHSLIGMGFECWIATKPPTGVPHAYADKAKWILRHLPDLKRRIIMTHDKGLLGDERDFLIDDRPHKANCEKFRGVLIPFVNGVDWAAVLKVMRAYRDGTGMETPADLVGALQDKVHADSGPFRAGRSVKETPSARPEHVAAHDCACAECVEDEVRCTCKDYPGADEFCTAHSTSNRRESL